MKPSSLQLWQYGTTHFYLWITNNHINVVDIYLEYDSYIQSWLVISAPYNYHNLIQCMPSYFESFKCQSFCLWIPNIRIKTKACFYRTNERTALSCQTRRISNLCNYGMTFLYLTTSHWIRLKIYCQPEYITCHNGWSWQEI